MKEETNQIDTTPIEFKLINSNAFYSIKIIGIFIGIIGVILAGLVFSRGANSNVLSRFVELPFAIEILLGILVFILVAISVSLQFNKNSDKGKLLLNRNKIEINKEVYQTKSNSIDVYFNSLKNKSSYKRKFLEGCNNWIEIRENGTLIKKEFRIVSKVNSSFIK